MLVIYIYNYELENVTNRILYYSIIVYYSIVKLFVTTESTVDFKSQRLSIAWRFTQSFLRHFIEQEIENVIDNAIHNLNITRIIITKQDVGLGDDFRDTRVYYPTNNGIFIIQRT